MNILIITHSYAPDPRPRAYRWTAIARAWSDRGARVDVVTTGRRGGETGRDCGVHVHCVGERLLGRLAEGSVAAPPTEAQQRGSPGIARRLYNTIWKRIFWPDYACLWYLPALREARRLCGMRAYDGVITVSHPFTGHLVGLSLKRALPGLRWVVDMGDPFSLDSTVSSNNAALYRRLNRAAERRILDRCDAVSVTVAGCKASLVDEFAIDRDKIAVIPPLLSLFPAPGEGLAPFERGDFIDLVYLGVLYPEIRRPDVLLSLLERLQARFENVRLHFIGDIQGCDDAFARFPNLMGRSVFLHGPVARNRVAAILAAADVLVNIGNKSAHQLPSKLVEYIAAGKPILNVVAGEADTSVGFLADYPRACSLLCTGDAPTECQVKQVAEFLERPPGISPACLDRIVRRFHVAPITDAYSRLIAHT